MGNALYEARRAAEKAERTAAEQREDERQARDKLATVVADLSLNAVRDFLSGSACLVIEPLGDGRLTVRFRNESNDIKGARE